MQDGVTPLNISSKNGHLAVVEKLLHDGASVEIATTVCVNAV